MPESVVRGIQSECPPRAWRRNVGPHSSRPDGKAANNAPRHRHASGVATPARQHEQSRTEDAASRCATTTRSRPARRWPPHDDAGDAPAMPWTPWLRPRPGAADRRTSGFASVYDLERAERHQRSRQRARLRRNAGATMRRAPPPSTEQATDGSRIQTSERPAREAGCGGGSPAAGASHAAQVCEQPGEERRPAIAVNDSSNPRRSRRAATCAGGPRARRQRHGRRRTPVRRRRPDRRL